MATREKRENIIYNVFKYILYISKYFEVNDYSLAITRSFGVQTIDNLGGSPVGCLEEGVCESWS